MIAGSNRAKFESRYDEANYKDYAEFINHKTNDEILDRIIKRLNLCDARKINSKSPTLGEIRACANKVCQEQRQLAE